MYKPIDMLELRVRLYTVIVHLHMNECVLGKAVVHMHMNIR